MIQLIFVVALCTAVDFLLLLGTKRICEPMASRTRLAIAAVTGGIYGGICMLPLLGFLGSGFWRAVSLVVIAAIAFGMQKRAWRAIAVFSLLSLSLSALGSGGIRSGLLAGLVIAGILLMGFWGGTDSGNLIPVELNHNGKKLHITALRDTGNTLKDPITGRPVLVLAAHTAQALTGLTRQQLETPVESLQAIPGLRLIPYTSVGQAGAFMLGMHMKEIRIGDWKGSALVAFAPAGLSSNEHYQALAGGYV